MKVYIKPDANYYAAIRYVLKTIERNQQLRFDYLDTADGADRIWDHTDPKSQIINLEFYGLLKGEPGQLAHRNIFQNEPVIVDAEGRKDALATIFYMINCLQEYSCQAEDLDGFGRYKFGSSYQFRFDNIRMNLVQKHIDDLLSAWKITGRSRKSTFFVSHDIDTIYGSILQDGFWALKNLRIDIVLQLLTNELIRKPHWKNMDQILRINDEYDVRSTFFWLVNRGKGLAGIKNADYDLRKEQALLRLVDQAGFTNGLHKSSSAMSLDEEVEKGKLNSTYNRYHFLKFLVAKDWKKISDSIIDFDGSLGFAEAYGFRNSYGMPFQPFDIEADRPHDFVEAPLIFMDATFHKYMKLPSRAIAGIIIEFFEKNPHNCVFSLLWHNTYFTDYKYGGFLDEYKKILGYIYENQIGAVTPDQIITETKLSW